MYCYLRRLIFALSIDSVSIYPSWQLRQYCVVAKNCAFIPKNTMKSIFATFLFVLCSLSLWAQSSSPEGFSWPEDYSFPQKDTFTVLSWNVEHFVDMHDNPYINNSREDAPKAEEQAQKVKLLVKSIREANADIVVLQEFESAVYLKSIAETHLKDMGYLFFAGNESMNWYMNVVVMSRYPLGISYGYRSIYSLLPGQKDAQNQDKRQININSRLFSQEVLLSPRQKILVTGVHLKAGRQAEDEATRLGQLDMLQKHLAALQKSNKKMGMLLVGDFNALPDGKELQSITNKKALLPWTDPLAGQAVFSHPAGQPNRRIDYLLFNQALQKAYLPGSLRIGGLLPNNEASTLSDHLPVRASFRK
jgi:endonuclease/exonuclease/phosphatase family metal-dependent hydrolase